MQKVCRILCFFLWLITTHWKVTSGVQQLTNPRIIEHPQDQYVAKNEPATLNCKAEGNPPPLITWFRNGRPVITANEDSSSHRMLLPSGQLFFLRIIHNKSQKPDVGTYYCKATNPETRVSVVSRNATLEIAVLRDDFRAHPRNTEVAVGDSAMLECKPPRGLPEPRIKWKKDDQQITPDNRVRIREGNLMIRDAEKGDSGVYVCYAHNTAGEKKSNPARVAVLEKPKFVKSPQDVLVDETHDAQFQCQATADPEPAIVWRKEDGSIPPDRSEILPDKSLKIKRVKIQDEGSYVCRAENSVGSVEAVGRLTVHSSPSFIVTPRDKTVGVGRRVSFRCEVTGNPPPAVFWNKETSQVLMFPRQDHGRFMVTDDGTLVIEPVRKDDAGEYICQALSVAGSALAKAKLQVKDVDPRPPPIIHQGPQNQTLPINSVAMLQCSASGDPRPMVRWYWGQRPVSLRDARFALLDSGTLQISDLRKTDTGVYTCKASSETGDTTWSAGLIVEAPTDPSVIFHRTPEPTTFPGTPSKPVISDVAQTSMRLSWKANANHGASPVQAYTVEYFSHETGDGWIVSSDTVTDQSYVVRGLLPDTAYMFLVRAQNSHGLSLPSQVTGPIRTLGGSGTRGRLPQYDMALVMEKLSGTVVHMKPPEVISSTAVKVNWEIKKSRQYIEGFHLKYRVMPNLKEHLAHRQEHREHHHVDFTIETISSPTTTHVLRNLAKFTWYEIRVQPFYLTYEASESNNVQIRTFEDVPSSPPQNVVTHFVDNTTLKVAWSPPLTFHHNGLLRGYKIFLYGNVTKFNREIRTNASVHEWKIAHLVPGLSYRLQISAFNRMGDGKKSDPLLLGGASSQNVMGSIMKEPWFIATLIGSIGGTLWFALCVFSIWLYRKRKARKKFHKNGTLSVPVHKGDNSRLGYNFGTLNAPNYMQKDIQNHVNSLCQPDVTNVRSFDNDDSVKNAFYHTPEVSPPQLQTFYNRSAPTAPVAAYATTTLVTGNNLLNQQPSPESAFRPIQPGQYIVQGSGSSDSCVKTEVASIDSNQENARLNSELLMPDNCHHCEAGHSPISEYGSLTADEEGALHGRLPVNALQPVLFLPPPPEHPPPSDIGTPPDSPTPGRSASPSCHYVPKPGHFDPRMHPQQGVITHPATYHPQSPTSRCHTMSPRAYLNPDLRTYSPRAMSEPERGPTPPVRSCRPVPDYHRHYSDTEGAPLPPLRMGMAQHHEAPPSPAPEDPMMDRGIQSSLPRLANEIVRNDRLSGATSHLYGVREDSPVYDGDDCQCGNCDMSGTRERDCPSPDSSVGGDPVNPAEWAMDGSDTNCSSVRSSVATSSDGSILDAETDFASAVARAAELSGLTVVGSTVSDPKAGRPKEKQKRPAKHRERAPRPSSPYSTDSNYSTVPPSHKPYPKSDRKRQLEEQRNRISDVRPKPAVRTKPPIPPHVADLPSYNKPSFPAPLGGATPDYSSAKHYNPRTPSSDQEDNFLRTNPMEAFDMTDTPIV